MKINHNGGLWVATINGKSYASDTLVNAMRIAHIASLPRRDKRDQVKARPIDVSIEEALEHVLKKHHRALAELAKV